MKFSFIFYLSITQLAIVHSKKNKRTKLDFFQERISISAANLYLGCFIDQIGDRDLDTFIGEYEQLTPQQCILACQERNFPFAAIQYGDECRCGQQYGKHGRISEQECGYHCPTSEKCGGDFRNSVYSVFNSLVDQSLAG